jgi:hypothetical protein
METTTINYLFQFGAIGSINCYYAIKIIETIK